MFSENNQHYDQSTMPPYSNGCIHDKVEIINETNQRTVSQMPKSLAKEH